MEWGKMWLVEFDAGKTQLVLLDQYTDSGAIDVKMNGYFLEKKSPFKIFGLTFYSKLNLFLLLKLSPRKLEPSFIL